MNGMWNMSNYKPANFGLSQNQDLKSLEAKVDIKYAQEFSSINLLVIFTIITFVFDLKYLSQNSINFTMRFVWDRRILVIFQIVKYLLEC